MNEWIRKCGTFTKWNAIHPYKRKYSEMYSSRKWRQEDLCGLCKRMKDYVETNKEGEEILKSLTGSKELTRKGDQGSLSGLPGPAEEWCVSTLVLLECLGVAIVFKSWSDCVTFWFSASSFLHKTTRQRQIHVPCFKVNQTASVLVKIHPLVLIPVTFPYKHLKTTNFKCGHVTSLSCGLYRCHGGHNQRTILLLKTLLVGNTDFFPDLRNGTAIPNQIMNTTGSAYSFPKIRKTGLNEKSAFQRITERIP
ncbi:hypothetical protein STEG23_032210 [Scotinomys teguina]